MCSARLGALGQLLRRLLRSLACRDLGFGCGFGSGVGFGSRFCKKSRMPVTSSLRFGLIFDLSERIFISAMTWRRGEATCALGKSRKILVFASFGVLVKPNGMYPEYWRTRKVRIDIGDGCCRW